MLFADVVVLLSYTVISLQRQLNILGDTARKLGLVVNLQKSKADVFRNGRHIAAREKLSFDGVQLSLITHLSLSSIHYHHHHHNQSLHREGPWGTTDDFATSFLHFCVFHCPLGPAELQACPFPNVVFPPLALSALSSSPLYCALQDCFGQT